jgi:hypothetical protein
MRNDLEMFSANQVYLLKDGTFILVSDVDPVTKFANNDKSRKVHYKIGQKYDKKKVFSMTYGVEIEDASTNSQMMFDCAQSGNMSIHDLKKVVGCYLGTLNGASAKRFGTTNSEYVNDL